MKLRLEIKCLDHQQMQLDSTIILGPPDGWDSVSWNITPGSLTEHAHCNVQLSVRKILEVTAE